MKWSLMSSFSKQLVFQDTLKAIIVDEAGQATEPETLAAITDSDAFVVLAGDHCQLGPTVMSPKAEQAGLGVSLLERLFTKNPYTNDGCRDEYHGVKLLRNFR